MLEDTNQTRGSRGRFFEVDIIPRGACGVRLRGLGVGLLVAVLAVGGSEQASLLK